MNDLELAHLEAGVRINKHALDDEFEDGPDRVRQVNAGVALAISHRDKCKAELEELEARTYLNVRQEHQGEKLSEATIRAYIDTDTDVIAKRRKLIDLNYELNQLEGLKASYVDRSFALRELAHLAVDGYYQQNSHRGTADMQASANRARMAEARFNRNGSNPSRRTPIRE